MPKHDLTRRTVCGSALAAAAGSLLAMPVSHAATRTSPPPPPLERRRRLLSAVKTWGIHLRKHHAEGVSAAPFDLMVIDYAPYRHLTFEFPFSRDEVAAMKVKSDGTRRLVLAYLSIGEAEDYRYYWRREWNSQAPDWIAPENPAWPGNFPVQFWRSEWEQILLAEPNGYLHHIQSAGFDGIYLDRADVFEEWVAKNPRAEQQMIALIGKIAAIARRREPEFLIVLQNAEELMRHASVRSAVDAIAKEDLFYEAEMVGGANPATMVEASLANLRRAKRAGLKVLVLEYVSDAKRAADARARAAKEGFLPHFAERSLGTLTLKGPDELPPSVAQPDTAR